MPGLFMLLSNRLRTLGLTAGLVLGDILTRAHLLETLELRTPTPLWPGIDQVYLYLVIDREPIFGDPRDYMILAILQLIIAGGLIHLTIAQHHRISWMRYGLAFLVAGFLSKGLSAIIFSGNIYYLAIFHWPMGLDGLYAYLGYVIAFGASGRLLWYAFKKGKDPNIDAA